MRITMDGKWKRISGSIICCILFCCLQKETVFAQEGTIYIVSKDGTGDFSSIMEGVEAVESGDTLLIYPGVYEEYIDIKDKTVNIQGVDRDLCILQENTFTYSKVPLYLAAGKVSNLTIYGMSAKEEGWLANKEASEEDIEKATEKEKSDLFYSGYAIHIEQDYAYGKDLCFENCKIVSDNNYCVGLGCRGESTVTFRQCEFISKGKGGALYFHDSPLLEYGGESYITMENCSIRNYRNPYFLAGESLYQDNTVYLTFQNVKVATVLYENTCMYNEENMNTGISVDALALLEKEGKLLEMGYLSPKVIHEIKGKEAEVFQKKLLEKKSSLEISDYLQEGITYFSINADNMPNEEGYTIFITNDSGESGDGWCGLDNTYLTKESYGNTFAEMNYEEHDESVY